ncbi:MAG: MMPL family transporter [Actinomycetota bacterium]|nr:MMPL family transporter [Actinomycetota bacterium]
MLQRLARTCYRRRRRVVAGWILLVAGLVTLNGAAGGEFLDEFSLPGTESQEAFDLLESHGFAARSGAGGQIVFQAEGGIDDPAVEATMAKLFDRFQTEIPDTEVVSPWSPGAERQVSQSDPTIAYAEVNLADRPSPEYLEAGETARRLVSGVDQDGLTVELGGDIFVEQPEFGSEGLGFMAAMVILLIAFGSVLAMGLPLMTAMFGIASGIALVGLAVNVIDMPSFSNQAVMMIAIGVGIDYALFIVTRYREGLHSGMVPEQAVVRAIDTAGRAVLFAGITVIIAVLGLFTVGLDMINGLAVGISLGVLMTMLAALTLLPAVLGFVGRNIDKLGLPHRRRAGSAHHTSVWFRWSRLIQRRPWPALVMGTIALVALAAPVASLRLGFGDAGNRATADTTRRAYDLLSVGFGAGFNGPLLLVAETPGGGDDVAALQALSDQLNDTDGVAAATPPFLNQAGDAAIMTVFPTTAPQDEATHGLVKTLRQDVIPAAIEGSTATVNVGGWAAAGMDFADYSGSRLPWFIGTVLVLSFLLLMTVFRSLLVPLKAVVMNLLSIGAAYGVIVAVFQWGWGASLIGVGKAGPVEAWAPMMLFAILFGLSMDYEVFLLSRIREDYDRTGDNAVAVANGLAATARVITAAAAIMIVVFGSFVLGVDRSIKLFGLGLAVAVLFDATIVRLVLVPATMELLGDRNWWLPKWLDRILPNIKVEAAPDDLDDELRKLGQPEPAAASLEDILAGRH